MSKNKQFIFLFFNYIYLIYNLLKHYFKISMKFPLNFPLEGDLRIWKSFLRVAITSCYSCGSCLPHEPQDSRIRQADEGSV